MKINFTLVLIFLWLVGTIGAGVASGLKGYKLAELSLKGVAQPKINVTKKSIDSDQSKNGQQKVLKFADEKTILAQVDNYIKIESAANDPTNQVPKSLATSQGVYLEVIKVSKEKDNLELQVKMTNKSTQTVNFAYGLLEARDDQGKAISTTTEGLPESLLADNKDYTGVIKIPLALLDNVQNISLSLTDYPAQKVRLRIEQIPLKP